MTDDRPDLPAAQTVPPAAHARRTFWALFVLIALIWIAPLGSRSLFGSDEGRYATLAWEMLRSGDWITPRLNAVLYFEKPPLTYWMGAAAFKVFGLNEFAARLWPGLAGLGCTLAAAWAARAWWGDEGALRSLACTASMSWLIGNSHLLTVDCGLAFGLALAMAGLMRGFAPGATPSTRRRALLVAWTGMALASLAKGLVGLVIPGGALVFYTLWMVARGDAAGAWKVWRGLEWLRGLSLYAVLTVPWFVAVSMRNPGFAEFFFIHEHYLRYTTPISRREGAWWYFVPLLLAGAFPWTTVIASGAWRAATVPGTADTMSATPLRPLAFLASWCVFVFLFFSLSNSKLPSYILPMFPALGLLAAVATLGRSPKLLQSHFVVMLGLWLAMLGLWLGVDRFVSAGTPGSAIGALLQWISVAAGVFAAGWGLAWQALRRGRTSAAIATVSVTHVLAMLVAVQGHDSFGQQKSADRLAAVIARTIPADAPVFSVQMVEQTLPFYLRRTVTLVDYQDEFEFGLAVEPQLAIPTVDAFADRWRSLPEGAALMSPALHARLLGQDLPMREIFRDPRRVVVVRR